MKSSMRIPGNEEALDAEAMDLKLVMKEDIHNNFELMDFEINNKTLAKMMNKEIMNHHSQAGMTTKAMKATKVYFEAGKFRHTRIEKNNEAHMLSRIRVRFRKAVNLT